MLFLLRVCYSIFEAKTSTHRTHKQAHQLFYYIAKYSSVRVGSAQFRAPYSFVLSHFPLSLFHTFYFLFLFFVASILFLPRFSFSCLDLVEWRTMERLLYHEKYRTQSEWIFARLYSTAISLPLSAVFEMFVRFLYHFLFFPRRLYGFFFFFFLLVSFTLSLFLSLSFRPFFLVVSLFSSRIRFCHH